MIITVTVLFTSTEKGCVSGCHIEVKGIIVTPEMVLSVTQRQ